MANSGNPNKRVRIPKTTRTRDRVMKTNVTNTKDFADWKAAGSPSEWRGPPDGYGSSGPQTKEDLRSIYAEQRAKRNAQAESGTNRKKGTRG